MLKSSVLPPFTPLTVLFPCRDPCTITMCHYSKDGKHGSHGKAGGARALLLSSQTVRTLSRSQFACGMLITLFLLRGVGDVS